MARAAAAVSVDRFFELALLGMVSSGFLAVAGSGYLDVPTAILTALGLLLRALLVTGVVQFTLSNRLVAAVTLGYIAFYPLDYEFISGEFLPATVHLVFFLAVMKVLTARATRDYIFVALVAFLELLAASVLSTSLNFFLFLALFLVFGVATFASAEIRRSIRKPRNLARGGLKRFHWRLAGLTSLVAAGILALTAGLFFLLPRTAQAAFQRFIPQRYHLPGFSNEVTLGEIGQIQQRRTPVMHIRFFGDAHPAGLKWRGVALAHFDGRRWYNPMEPGEIRKVEDGYLNLKPDARGVRGIQYEVQLNSMGSDTLFFAGDPLMLRINVPLIVHTPTGGYRLGYGTSEGLHYGVYSALDQDRGPNPIAPLPEAQRLLYTELPRALDSRIPELARQASGGSSGEEDSARAIENYLRVKYRYTLELPTHEVPDPLAYFLFARYKGHCEYFASAMAVMLRTIQIPARVVNGFQSGIYNPVSGWYIVRASDAHSWVEAWIPGRGWETFDPTPPDFSPHRASVWSRLGMYLDAADTFWQEWVLNYNLDRQLILASRMENSSRSLGVRWMDRLGAGVSRSFRGALSWVGRYGVVLIAALLAAYIGLKHGPRSRAWWQARVRLREAQRGAAIASDATLLYARMLRLLKSRGFEKPSWLTPAEFAAVLPASDTAAVVREFTAAYNGLRFGGRASAAPRMVALLEQLERA